MNSRFKKLLTLVSVLALSVLVFTGTALAHGPGPVGPDTGNDEGSGSWLGQMQQWMDETHGPGSWDEMIQWMTQTHGSEFTGQMLQWMNESGGCHGYGDNDQGDNSQEYNQNYTSPGFQGMHGNGSWGGMMGRGNR